ncbi:hypothetical protein ACRAR1_26150 [Streptomyces sanyensis]|uniref:hypothetical protein n=1 Tax=Streptomyces sanyensis TaxID=568869 RepID=UPI003D778A52
MRNRTTLRGRRRPRTQRPTPPEAPEPWWKRHARTLWLGAGIPVIGAVVTAIALQLLGLGGESGPSPVPAPSGTASGRPSTAPFVVTARQEDDAGCTALPRRVSSPEDRADLVSGGDAGAVVRRNQGARVGELRVGLTLEGGASSLTVTSIGIRPTSPRAVEPLAGTLVCEPDGGGEAKIQLYADMDSPAPVFLQGRDSAQEYFRGNVVTLDPGEQVNLSATFSSEQGSREFELLIHYVQNGKEGTVPVPAPRGGRYAVTGFATRYGAVYEGSDGGVYRRLDDSRPCRWAPGSPGC